MLYGNAVKSADPFEKSIIEVGFLTTPAHCCSDLVTLGSVLMVCQRLLLFVLQHFQIREVGGHWLQNTV